MVPEGKAAGRLERRAARIADPIERLRYLRGTIQAPPPAPRRWLRSVTPLLLLLWPTPTLPDAVTRRPPQPQDGPPTVWLVEEGAGHELYSNGLRIENHHKVAHVPRRYVAWERGASGRERETRSEPAGIVFHGTESQLAPFEERHTGALRRIGDELLAFVARKRAYHFVVDRFGRVHRVVREDHAANHAGYSVWADSQRVYVNLNASFLAIALETHGAELNPAQVEAARRLTDLLRSRYHLLPGNCVTHAQVSVNPSNMRLGYHSDWGDGFPWGEIGLPENYLIPPPAITLFGFDYDAAYIQVTSPRLRQGLAFAEHQLREAAALGGLSVTEYRKGLRQSYPRYVAVLEQQDTGETP